jgi:quinol monooxygenase YgiN
MSRLIGMMLVIGTSCAALTPAFAQQSSAGEQYVVTYVETIPARQEIAEGMLQNYVRYASSQPGVVRFDLEREAGFTNRYAIRQEWKNASAYTAFLNASQGWTNYLAPVLDAPFDNRLGNFVN